MLLFCILVYVSNRSSLLFYDPVSGLLLSVGDTATSCFWVGCHCYSYVSFVFVFAYKFVFVFVLGLQIGLLLFLEGAPPLSRSAVIVNKSNDVRSFSHQMLMQVCKIGHHQQKSTRDKLQNYQTNCQL